jgi:hypothetical protein
VVDIRLSAGGGEVARASVLRLRTEALAVPAGVPQPAFDRPPPEAGEPSAMPAGAGFGSLFQLSSVGGAFRVPGPRPSGSDLPGSLGRGPSAIGRRPGRSGQRLQQRHLQRPAFRAMELHQSGP